MLSILYCIELIQFNSWNLPTLFSFKLGVRVTSIDNLAVISSLIIKSSVFQFHKIYKLRLFLQSIVLYIVSNQVKVISNQVFSSFIKFTSVGYFFFSSKSKNHVLSSFAVFVAILYYIELIQPYSWLGTFLAILCCIELIQLNSWSLMMLII